MRPLLVLALGVTLFAQPPQTQQDQKVPDDLPTIKVDVDVVNVLASVRDKHGSLVPNLEKSDFTILEDGKPQPIKYFTRETDLPLTIGLLIDVSGSQANLIQIERDAAAQFFGQVLRKKDEAFLLSFGEEAELLQDYTNSPKLLISAMRDLRVSSGVGGFGPGPVPTVGQPRGTVLYDAVYLAATEKLKNEVGRKVLVVITDGVDEGSRISIKDALMEAQKADAVIYSIEYEDPGAYGRSGWGISLGGGMGSGTLHQLSDETGGHVYRVDRKNTLDVVFKELQDEMRSQYAIGYTPLNDKKDGSYRKLDIKLSNKDLKAQARKGYYAIKTDAR
ncbi:MAG TPA: VWA domain-containing protein [Bryobacteraceae bacterium]|nr:VWA domain-containing protein [Bryobacteraceae bacterium]